VGCAAWSNLTRSACRCAVVDALTPGTGAVGAAGRVTERPCGSNSANTPLLYKAAGGDEIGLLGVATSKTLPTGARQLRHVHMQQVHQPGEGHAHHSDEHYANEEAGSGPIFR